MPKNLVRPTSKGQVTIPKSIRNKLKIDSETFLYVSLENDKIVIQPVSIKATEGLRDYADEQVEEFLEEDKLGETDRTFLDRILRTSKY